MERIKKFVLNTHRHRVLLFMCIPGIILIIMFSYIPMVGLVLAFKRFDYSKGIFGSDWVALDNFSSHSNNTAALIIEGKKR